MTRDLDSLENNYNIWDDVWMIRETENEATPGSELPSDKD